MVWPACNVIPAKAGVQVTVARPGCNVIPAKAGIQVTGCARNSNSQSPMTSSEVRIEPSPHPAVLFVCTGNICRSPLAEGVFRRFVEQVGLSDRVFIDSAGTGDSQVGQPPDPRALIAAARRGYELPRRRARQFLVQDFKRFDWILAMDKVNLRELQALRPSSYSGHLGLLLGMAGRPGPTEIPDPYHGSIWEFEHVIELVEQGAEGLLAAVRNDLKRGATSPY